MPRPTRRSSPSPRRLALLGAAIVALALAAAAPAGAADTVTLVPWSDSGYRYLQVPYDGAPSGFQQPAFDDSSWSTGTAAFGAVQCGPPFQTNWDLNTEVLLRKDVEVPAAARNLVVHAAIDNDIQVFFNGHDISSGLVTHEFCASPDNVGPFAVPDAFVDPGGANVLAVRARDRGVFSFVDVSVDGQIVGPQAEMRQAIAFGPRLMGRTTSNGGVVTVHNTGGARLNVSGLTLDGVNPHQFSITDDTCTRAAVAVGGQCRFRVRYAPTVAGDVAARVEIADDAADSPQKVALAGTGLIEPRVRVRSALAFPDTAVGIRSPRGLIVVRNTGNAPLTISGLSLGGADPGEFTLRDKTCLAAPIAAGARCSFKARSVPTAPGPHTATGDIADDAPGSPQHVALSGAGS